MMHGDTRTFCAMNGGWIGLPFFDFLSTLISSFPHISIPLLLLLIHRLYFSAYWCKPCRKFTPLLTEAYNAHKKHLLLATAITGEGDDDNNNDSDIGEIEVIFISLDSVQSEYNKYRNTMPWLSVPFTNLHKLRIRDNLSGKYGVRMGLLPDLIVLNGSGSSNGGCEVVSRNGRGEYVSYFKGETAGSSWGCIMS